MKVQRTVRGFFRINFRLGAITITRPEAEQLRDSLTEALREGTPPSPMYLKACALHDEARTWGADTEPPEAA